MIVEIYAGGAVTETPLRVLSAPRTGATWAVTDPTPLPPGTYTVRARQTDASGNEGISAPSTFNLVAPPDSDADGIPDAVDNCAGTPNSDQTNADGDGLGNACDPTPTGGSGGPQPDRDRDGIPDSQDTSDASVGPTLAKTVVATVVSGQVFYSLPASSTRSASSGSRLIPLKGAEVLPLGATLHTQRGRVGITSSAGTKNGKAQTQRADFFKGRFKIKQKRAKQPITDIQLSTPDFAKVCGSSTSRTRGFAAKKKNSKKVVNQLNGDGKGRFRTSGRNSAATVRGTKWLTQERCDGTLTRVTRGIVSVRDTRAQRTVVLRAGRSYLARAQRAATKSRRP